MSDHLAPAVRGVRGARAAVLAACALFALALPTGALAVVNLDDDAGLADFDTRTASVAPTDAQVAAVDAIGANVTWSQFGTPATLLKRTGGNLATGVQGADAEAAARNWLSSVSSLYRLGAIDGLELYRSVPLGAGSAVIFRQTFDGVTSTTDGIATVALTGSASAGWNVVYASSTLAPADSLSGTAQLSATEAYVQAADAAGADVSVVDVDATAIRQGWTQLAVTGLSESTQLVRHVAFPTPKRGVRNAYDTMYTANGGNEGYRQVVDAETGEILLRESIVDYLADNPTWLAFPANPLQTRLGQYPWDFPSDDIRELWCWTSTPSCKFEADNPASPAGWDTNAATNTPTFTTTGNNNDNFEAWLGNAGNNFRPVSATRDYTYPWTNVWYTSKCDPANLTTVGVGNDISAAVVNLFTMHNRLHDFAYNLGFTEVTFNSQTFNFGKGGAQNDAVRGRAQSGAVTPGSRNNANMNTGADGVPATTNMFLWQPQAAGFYPPCVDGDYDMSVIGHEFGHMVENRMIGKGLGPRQGTHAGAMGEAFGDMNAGEYLHEYNYVPVGGADDWAEGAYATGNPTRGIRNYNTSWPSTGPWPSPGKQPKVNPLNLAAYGYDIVGPEVHSDGEMWVEVNYNLRQTLLERYQGQGQAANVACAEGERAVETCPGNRRWFQLYHDAMLLMPRNTTILQARDAILAADTARFGGADLDLLWRAFAQRGFGQFATVTSNGDTNPVASYESPLEDEETLTFVGRAKDEAGNPPVTFQLFLGTYEARITPLAHTASFVMNKEGWDFLATAPGYGFVRFHVDSTKPGASRTITIDFPTNWASRFKGTIPTGDGTGQLNLIDDTENTNWSSTTAPVQGKQVLLSFGAPRTFNVAKVSAMLAPGNNRYAALRSFALYACNAGGVENPTCDPAVAAGWTQILLSQDDAFPGAPGRPVAPEMQLRTWNVPTTTATHVRFVVVANQCTGNPAFQGEQDNDPRAATDCRTNATANGQVRAAEVQLMSSKPKVDGATREQ